MTKYVVLAQTLALVIAITYAAIITHKFNNQEHLNKALFTSSKMQDEDLATYEEILIQNRTSLQQFENAAQSRQSGIHFPDSLNPNIHINTRMLKFENDTFIKAEPTILD